MPPSIGAGWAIHHVTDRTVELRKDDLTYRRLTGSDGYVRVRVEPQMTRQQAIELAMGEALKNDAKISELVARQLMPNVGRLNQYRSEQNRLRNVFAVPSEEEKVYRA